ncbi:MerR family DNA-binding protein [Rhodococcus sp. T7]|uniref:MerR family DNA-binding protein n=1 Tax=Rhodococcus sp. T7 TaxID=627444 RepID=UPI0013C7E664|nr:MerR family DNA-binding protein [Rhodococcus sp. T7]KAF0965762.1 hypothetical protein MLGJGCBP_00954 [Rhodococcus sp. T7]
MSAYRISQLAEISRRVYGEEAVERLSFISSAKHLGLPLEEIRDLLEVWERGVCAQVRQRMLPMVTDRIAHADNRIAELSAFAARLAGVREELTGSAPAGACGPDCGCLTATTATPVPVPLERSRPTRPPEQAWRNAPVVCTLGSGEYDERARQWRQVLSAATGREEIDGGLRVWFPSDPDLVAEVARLAAAEQSCCTFFDFTMQLTVDRLTVTIRPRGRRRPAQRVVRVTARPRENR